MDPIHTWRCWERIETLFCRGCGWQVARLSSCTCTCAFAPQAASVMSHGASYSWSSPNTKGSIRNLLVELLSCHLNNKWFPQIYHQINDLGLISHCSNLSMGLALSWSFTIMDSMDCTAGNVKQFNSQVPSTREGSVWVGHPLPCHQLPWSPQRPQKMAGNGNPDPASWYWRGAHMGCEFEHFITFSSHFFIFHSSSAYFFAVNPFRVLVCA